MAAGKKTGGRVVGTPNKRTVELAARLESLGIDPLAGLAEIANDPSTSLELRAKVHCDLLAYLYPKKRAVDLSSQGQAVSIRIGIPAKPNPAGPVDLT
jgi:hypothetical protein